MKMLMELLGNPQDNYPTIHITGTSGKGSTSTILASILATRYKVGLYTSPHLVRVNERIKILQNCESRIMNQESRIQKKEIWNNFDINDDEFVRVLNSIIPAVEKMEKTNIGPPSYFEIITAMAFMEFASQKVDIAVIEVGMGGRFDATNVISPLVSVITNIGLDHTEVLGKTVEKIARDKAGIIKRGTKVVSGVKKSSIVRIIELKCKKERAEFSLLSRDFRFTVKHINETESVFNYSGERSYENIHLSLIGRHQVENASIAIRTIEELNNGTIEQWNNGGNRILGYNDFRILSEDDIRTGIRNVYIPGRFEIIHHNPTIIIDGAHNTDKMKALVDTVETIYSGKKVTVVLAIKNDKDAVGMIAELNKIAESYILCAFHSEMDTGDIISYEPAYLEGLIHAKREGIHVTIVKNPYEAFKSVTETAKREDVLLITGSLYLIGEIYKILNQNIEIRNNFQI